MQIEASVVRLLGQAGQSSRDRPVYFVDGDLCQMSAQQEFLRSKGYRLGFSDVYPGLYTEDDWKRALKDIWESRVEGWWHYLTHYQKYGICTKEQFDAALDARVARDREDRERERRRERW